jgi:hypothetical protein
VLALRADLRDDAAILGWVREHLAPTSVIGIDTPTFVRNASGTLRLADSRVAVLA